MVIQELLVALGFEFDSDSEKEVKKYNEAIKKSIANIGKLILGTAAAGAAIVAFVAKVSEGTDKLGKSAEVIGITVDELDALSHAAGIATGNSDGLIGNMERLSRISSEATRGVGSGVEAFGMLGVSVTGAGGKIKNTNTLLLEVADALKDVESNSLRLELAEKLGLGGLDLLLKRGSSGINQLTNEARELGVVTDANAKLAAEFNDSLLKSVIRRFKILTIEIANKLIPVAVAVLDVAVAAIPVITTLMNDLEAFVELIGGVDVALKFLIATIGILIAFNIGRLLTTIIGLVKFLIPLITGVGNAGLIANAKAAAGLVLVGALIGVIFLALEDIWTSLRGGDGLLAKVIAHFPALEDSLLLLAFPINAILDTIMAIVKLLTDPLSTDAWKAFFDEMKNIGSNMVNGIFGAIVRNLQRIVNLINKIPGIDKIHVSGFENLTLSGVQDTAAGMLTSALGVNTATNIPAPATGGNMSSSTNITINGATDPKETARLVGIEIDNRNREALRNLRKGVKQ